MKKTFANKYCDNFSLGSRQLNCTRQNYNPTLLPAWQRAQNIELPEDEQQALVQQLHQQNKARDLQDKKHALLRERLKKNGMMTTWESRGSMSKSPPGAVRLTCPLPGSPSCVHCFSNHCPIRPITAIWLSATPTKDWVLSRKLFCKRAVRKGTSTKWKVGSLFLGNSRVTLIAV